MAKTRYCPKCDIYISDSDIVNLFHNICHCRTVPRWSEERRGRLRAEKRIKELEAALQRIDNWAKAYPVKAFPEPDLQKAAKVLKAAGLTLDAISASNMRHVLDGVKDIVEQSLKGEIIC